MGWVAPSALSGISPISWGQAGFLARLRGVEAGFSHKSGMGANDTSQKKEGGCSREFTRARHCQTLWDVLLKTTHNRPMASRFFCPTGLPLPLARYRWIRNHAPLSGPVWEYRGDFVCGDKLFGFGLGLLAPSALLSHLPRLTGEESFVEIWVLLRPPSRRAGAGAAGRGSLAFAPQGE